MPLKWGLTTSYGHTLIYCNLAINSKLLCEGKMYLKLILRLRGRALQWNIRSNGNLGHTLPLTSSAASIPRLKKMTSSLDSLMLSPMSQCCPCTWCPWSPPWSPNHLRPYLSHANPSWVNLTCLGPLNAQKKFVVLVVKMGGITIFILKLRSRYLILELSELDQTYLWPSWSPPPSSLRLRNYYYKEDKW